MVATRGTGRALAREVPDWTITRLPVGGLHLWIQLPPGRADSAVADAARAHGMARNSGSRYFPAEPPTTHLRLGFAAAADLSELAEGARRLNTASRDNEHGADDLGTVRAEG